MEPVAHIGQCKEGTAVHARLAVDVDDTASGASQIRKQRLFKGGIPVQNPVRQGVMRTETGIHARELGPEPRRTVLREGTVDDMGDAAFIDELGGQIRPGTHENAGVEVGRRLAKIVRDRD
jgi:hypothetical protein